jgi:Zn-dependent protease
MHLFINYLWEDPDFFFMQILVVVFAICCHEYMHARVALWQGDSTAADQGHLTLNPLRQMGPISLVMLAIIGIAWGQVPVNPNRMRHKYSDALVSFAGPATNLVLAVIFCFAAALFVIIAGKQDPAGTTMEIGINAVNLFYLGAILNFVLFVFNMLPAPGFDGWHILSSFLPKLKTSDSQATYFVSLVILILAMNYIEYIFLTGKVMTSFIIYGIVHLAKMLGA